MTTKTLTIAGKEVSFRSSAAIPRLYRMKFKRDIFKDIHKLDHSYQNTETSAAEFAIEDLELFENVAYIMARHANPAIPDSVEEWLDQFEMFSIYEILPEILDMWGMEMHVESESKKNFAKATGK